jgi:putative methionine-R-sulfoxide reductase with GAF domain
MEISKEREKELQIVEDIYDYCEILYNKMSESKTADYITFYNLVTELGKLVCNVDRASFWQWDKEKNVLWTISATELDRVEVADDIGIVGKALQEKRTIVTNDPYNDSDFNKSVDMRSGYTTKNVMVVPIYDINGNCIGVYEVINKNDGDFDAKRDSRKLSVVTVLCGMALQSEKFEK